MYRGYCVNCYNLKVVKAEEIHRDKGTVRKLTVTCKVNRWVTDTGKVKTLSLQYYILKRKGDKLRPFGIPRFTHVPQPCLNRISPYTHERRSLISIPEARQLLKKVLYDS